MLGSKRVFFISICVLLASLLNHVFAQDQLVHTPKVYVSKSGNLFWNRKLPVYLKIAASPDDTAKSYLVKTTMPQYADPYYLDTEGENFFRSKWAVDRKTGEFTNPRMEVQWKVYNDGKAPVSKVQFFGAKSLNTGKKTFFGNGVKITLSAQDLLSGTESIYYSINRNPYQIYTDSITIAEQGEYTLKYYAVDRVGNVEKPQGLTFVIDATAPSTEIAYLGDWEDAVCSARSSVKLSASDDLSGVKSILYKVDDGEYKPYTGTIPVGSLSEGEHTLTYRAIDNIGNKEDLQEFTFYIDKRPPMVSMEIIGDKYVINGKEYSSGRTRIKLTAIDNKAGVKEVWYSVNGAPYQLYSSPFYLTGKAGNRTIKYYAVDKVNNKNVNADGSNQNIGTPYLDLTGPRLAHRYSGPQFLSSDTMFISPKTKINLSAADDESGVQKISYKINDGEETDYNEPVKVADEGYHEITQYGYDNVNNSNRQQFYFMLDAQGPEIITNYSVSPVGNEADGSLIYPRQVELYLAATDAKVGSSKIVYSINGSVEKVYASPIKGFEAGKKYEVKITAYDYLENSNTQTIIFYTSK